MQLSARKSRGIDEVIGTMQPSVPETERKPVVTPRGVIDKLVQRYIDNLGEYVAEAGFSTQTVYDILTPAQINEVLRAASVYTYTLTEDCNDHINLGHLISALLQNSYNVGHNNFTLNTGEIKHLPAFLAMDLVGRDTKPVRIRIEGNSGHYCGFKSRYTRILIIGDAFEEEHGCNMEDSSLTVEGNVHGEFGSAAVNSTFTIINGKMINPRYSGSGSTKCTFRTNNYETLEQFKQFVQQQNRLLFIEANGREQIVRDFP